MPNLKAMAAVSPEAPQYTKRKDIFLFYFYIIYFTLIFSAGNQYKHFVVLLRIDSKYLLCQVENSGGKNSNIIKARALKIIASLTEVYDTFNLLEVYPGFL